MYVIKLFKIKNIKNGQIKTWDLECIGNLPYEFTERPVEICNQLNEMFKNCFEHYIVTK